MSILINNASTWSPVLRCNIRNSGTWIEPSEVYIRDAGNWHLVHKVIYANVDANNVDLHVLAGSPTSPLGLVYIINAGVVIGSTSVGSPSITFGALPAGSHVTIVNNGTIAGKGGNGGPGGGGAGSNGQAGGHAVNMTTDCYLFNNGIIGGGGGGGAGGATWPGHDPAVGGGGGGAGRTPGNGGAGYMGGNPGQVGTLLLGGLAGGGHCLGTPRAGNLGQAGPNSGNCDAQPGATGGAAGRSFSRNGFTLDQRVAGDIRGPIV